MVTFSDLDSVEEKAPGFKSLDLLLERLLASLSFPSLLAREGDLDDRDGRDEAPDFFFFGSEPAFSSSVIAIY